MVADLLEAGEQGEHETPSLRVVGGEPLDALHRVADERLVEHRLLPGQAEQLVGLGLRRQLRRDPGVGLAAAEQERPDQVGELARLGRLDPGLDGRGPDPPEGLAAPEQAGDRPVEDRPELGELVLDGRAGQRDPRAARDGAQRAGGRGAGVLDVLGLVGDHEVPRHGGEGGAVAPHGAVRRQHEPLGEVERPRRAVEAAYGHPGREPLDLRLPVAEQRGGTHDQRRPAARQAVLEPVQVQGDQRDRLAEAHVVGQAGPETEAGEVGEPGQAVPLVVAEVRAEPGRRGQRVAGRGREQPFADRQQAGADHDLLGGGLVPGLGRRHLRHPRQRGGERLHPAGAADEAAPRALGGGRVDDRPGAAQLEHRARGSGERLHLLVGQRVAAQCHLPGEGEQAVGRERAVLQRLLGVPGGRAAVEDGAGGQLRAQ